ncbi:hypothetical protein IQ266_00290 [filamentous cyanobacterium LEGE 11480]|uniref:Uncharacterized protein n=1 Tax=Romeriopsis navalis LEGE 11480 TaxID=2777977 RepID=A0A928VGI5_9CYAN|nr:hypothetical protein [Romeriopsis navalis]MBE9028191.1 hypothetical protein [Romeriopsis navalis LEGE 11480]
MKKILAACFVPACVALIGTPIAITLQTNPAQAQTRSTGWQSFRPQRQGFTIQMPKAAITRMGLNPKTFKLEQTTIDLTDSARPKTHDGDTFYIAQTQNKSMSYSIGVTRIPPSVRKSLKASMSRPNRSDPNSYQKLIAQQSFTLGGHPGKELTYRTGWSFKKQRMFVVNDLMYTVTSEYTTLRNPKISRAHQQSMDYFLRSFKLAQR